MPKLNKLREQIVNTFLDALNKNKIPWHQEWSVMPAVNAVTNKEYNGINSFWLGFVAGARGYKDPRWCTFKQANDNGWKVKKGEKGTRVEFWSMYDTEEKTILTPFFVEELKQKLTPEEFQKRVKPLSNIYTVFNGSQIEGIPEIKIIQPYINTNELISCRDKLLSNMQLDFKEGGNRAFYSPFEDSITMPPIEQFKSTYGYMSVLLHESAHATGAKSRLNRDLNGMFGGEKYAKEELRAEIASAFTSQVTGIKYEQSPEMENHTAYIQSWISVLKNNPNELFSAIKDAEKISDYLIEKGEFAKEIITSEQNQKKQSNYTYKNVSENQINQLKKSGIEFDVRKQNDKEFIIKYVSNKELQIQQVLNSRNLKIQ